jgi:tetratricopeptide (TPR) repeat protein
MVRAVVSGLLIASLSAFTAQSRGQGAAEGASALQHLYQTAVESQKAGHPDLAAGYYRQFLSGMLGVLALRYSVARDYAHAAPLFDDALALEPHSSSLLLAYAQSALALGDADHARMLAMKFLRTREGSREQMARAHQVLGRSLLKLNQDQQARKEFQAAVDIDPTFANGYDLAVACLDLDDEPCADQIFGEMEKSFGDTAQIHFLFGRAYGDSDFQPRAVTEFRRAIQENPRLPGVHYLLAAVLLATGDDASHVQQAQEELKKELAISPRDAMSYAALGHIAAGKGNNVEAEADLTRAAALDPKNPDPWLYLGQLDFDMHRFSQAESALRHCIQLTTDVSRNRYQVQKAHFLLGRILMQKGQQDAAHEQMQIARDLANKTLAQDKTKLAALLDEGAAQNGSPAPAGASSEYGAAAEIDKSAESEADSMRRAVVAPVADSYSNLAIIEASDSNYADAMELFEHAYVWNPALSGLDYNWGRAAFAGSRFADAVAPLSRYLRSHPDDRGARSVLAISQFMTGDNSGCVRTMTPVIGKGDVAPEADYAYAEALVKTGEVASGMERLLALEKAHPDIPDVHRALGEAMQLQGSKAQAKEEFAAAIRLNPRDGQSHYDLGAVELAAGDPAAAVMDLETAVRLSPETSSWHEELARAYLAASRPQDAQREMHAAKALEARTQSSPPQPAPAPQP